MEKLNDSILIVFCERDLRSEIYISKIAQQRNSLIRQLTQINPGLKPIIRSVFMKQKSRGSPSNRPASSTRVKNAADNRHSLIERLVKNRSDNDSVNTISV